MAKKIVKKKKLKVFRLLLILIVLGVIVFAVDLYLNTSIKNITIKNTKYLKDDYILYLAGLEDYPSFYYTTTVKENQPLFIYETDKKLIFENKKEVPIEDEITLFRVPRLMNYVPNTKYTTFKKNMTKIDKSILGKISEITYLPNEYDKDRFLLYMDDGNSVYLTLTKFKMINYYNDVLKQLEGRKGILYLDSGNHFKVME